MLRDPHNRLRLPRIQERDQKRKTGSPGEPASRTAVRVCIKQEKVVICVLDREMSRGGSASGPFGDLGLIVERAAKVSAVLCRGQRVGTTPATTAPNSSGYGTCHWPARCQRGLERPRAGQSNSPCKREMCTSTTGTRRSRPSLASDGACRPAYARSFHFGFFRSRKLSFSLPWFADDVADGGCRFKILLPRFENHPHDHHEPQATGERRL